MLTTVAGVIAPGGQVVTFVVPGDQNWVLRSIFARCATAVGGAPNRGFLLTVTDQTDTVAQAGAADAGTEPADVSITWSNGPQGAVTAGNTGVSSAPLANLKLEPGYTIILSIENPAAADRFEIATAWYDYTYTT